MLKINATRVNSIFFPDDGQFLTAEDFVDHLVRSAQPTSVILRVLRLASELVRRFVDSKEWHFAVIEKRYNEEDFMRLAEDWDDENLLKRFYSDDGWFMYECNAFPWSAAQNRVRAFHAVIAQEAEGFFQILMESIQEFARLRALASVAGKFVRGPLGSNLANKESGLAKTAGEVISGLLLATLIKENKHESGTYVVNRDFHKIIDSFFQAGVLVTGEYLLATFRMKNGENKPKSYLPKTVHRYLVAAEGRHQERLAALGKS